jgi:hypothetical protein
MMCPRCGNRRVNLIFEPPPVPKRASVASGFLIGKRPSRQNARTCGLQVQIWAE